MKPEERFHEHHQRLIDDFKQLRDRALEDPETHGPELVEFLEGEIRPHAEAEEDVLYAELNQLAGDDIATGTMRSEHETLAGLIEKLDETTNQPGLFEEHLITFSTILLNHFKKEEDVLIPYLSERLSKEAFLDILGEVHESEEQHAHSTN
jgi:iron-sulfur cluster repair protein YtfE (RIC family)